VDDYEIIECIDDGLDRFGQSIKYTIYWRLTILHSVPRGGILASSEAFVQEIRSVFGEGAKAIENAIVRKIVERSGLEGAENLSLPEVIRLARRENEISACLPLASVAPRKL
jgi:hypothetical protein